MGCDLHVHVELMINGLWEHYQHLDPPRNYAVFSLMANVRNDGSITPFKEPSGLPENITQITKIDYENENYRSASSFSQEEIKGFAARLWDEFKIDLEEYLEAYLFGNTYGHKESLLPNINDVRFVFWFDN